MLVKLEYPVQHGDKTIAELDLHRLTAGELAASESAIGGDDIAARMAAAGGLIPHAQMVRLISASARVPPSVVAQLDAADFGECSTVVRGFLSRGGRAAVGGPA